MKFFYLKKSFDSDPIEIFQLKHHSNLLKIKIYLGIHNPFPTETILQFCFSF